MIALPGPVHSDAADAFRQMELEAEQRLGWVQFIAPIVGAGVDLMKKRKAQKAQKRAEREEAKRAAAEAAAVAPAPGGVQRAGFTITPGLVLGGAALLGVGFLLMRRRGR